MRIKKYVYFIAAFTIMLMIAGVTTAFAGNVNIRFVSDNTTVDVSSNITVSMVVEGDADISEMEAAISYNASVLTFLSGGDFINGGDGYLRLSDKLNTGGTTRTYSMEFNVIGAGDSEITINGAPVIFDTNYEEMTYAFSPVTITGASTQEASTDASLSSIKLSPGTMEGTFAPETLTYQITLPYEETAIVVSALPTDENAKVTIDNTENLETGWNTAEITVTAPAGNTQTYTLSIYRQFEDEVEATPEPENKVLDSNEELIIVEEQGRIFLSNSFAYEIVNLEDASLVPDGYKKTKINLYGTTVTAYVLENDPKNDYMLFYAANKTTGDTNFYQYDKVENTIQRFNGETTATVSKAITVSEMTDSEYQKKISVCAVVIALLAALLAVTLVFAIKLVLKTQDMKKDSDSDEDEEEDDDILE